MNYPRKRFGQHWLRDGVILQKIVDAATVDQNDRILEIGPGQGVLTQELLQRSAHVVAVEVDRDLCRELHRRWGDRPNFLLLQGSVLELDLFRLLRDFPKFQNPKKVVANIPYNITGPILELLLGRLDSPPDSPFDRLEQIVLLVQREVADRLCATPSHKTFGALSVRVQYRAECQRVCDVPPQAFHPRPQVHSAVISLRPRPWPCAPQNPQHLARLVKVGFGAKRKMLRNNLKGWISAELMDGAFAEVGLRATDRAEDVGVAQWIALSDYLVRDSLNTV